MVRAFLRHVGKHAVEISNPKRGARARRVQLALDNARASFDLRFRAPQSQAQHLARRIGEALGLPGPVSHLECFDISHSSGKETTASCVVWQDGRMNKRQYRSFNIREVEGVDDFSAIAEIFTRSCPRRVVRSVSCRRAVHERGILAAPSIMPRIDPTVAPLQSVSKPAWTARQMLLPKSPSPYSRAVAQIMAFGSV